MINKQIIYLDFDNTLVNSTKAFCEVYNAYLEKDMKKADWTKVDKWNFSDECPNLSDEEVERYFSTDYFYMLLRAFPDAIDVLKELVKVYEIRICSIGTPMNIQKKIRWVQQNITPFVPEVGDGIYLVKKDAKMDKSAVNMYGAIMIDDSVENLRSSNANFTISFGDIHEWNREWYGFRTMNWLEVKELLVKECWWNI